MERPVYILGISFHWYYSAATLICDGKIISNHSEENNDQFPHESIKYCLQKAAIDFKDLSYVVFYDKPLLKFEQKIMEVFKKVPFSFFEFLAASNDVIRKRSFTFKQLLKAELEKYSRDKLPLILFSSEQVSRQSAQEAGLSAVNLDAGAALSAWVCHLKQETANVSDHQFFEQSEFNGGAEVKVNWVKEFYPAASELSASSLRKFGIVMGLILTLGMGLLLPFLREKPSSVMALFTGCILILSAVIAPQILKFPFIVWMIFARSIGRLKSWVLYVMLYIFLVCPYAVILRVFFISSLNLENEESRTPFRMDSVF